MNDEHDAGPPTGPKFGGDPRTDVDRFWSDLLAQAGIAHGHRALFLALDYEFHEPPEKLPARARAEYNGMLGRDVVTAEDCRAALADGLARGWLQVIDQRALDQIADGLRTGGVLGPLCDLPPIGAVDYTAAGAELWHSLCDKRWLRARDLLPASMRKPFVAVDCVWVKTAHFYPSRDAARRGIGELWQYDGVASITDPVPIGPWRAQWWRRFPVGYRVDVVEIALGSRVVDNEHVWIDWLRPADVTGLRQVLERHNVTAPEWLMMWAIDEGIPGSPSRGFCRNVIQSARRSLRFRFPDDAEEKARQGWEACLRHGWLRIADASSDAEIQKLIEDGAAFLAVPDIARNHLTDVYSSTDPDDPTKQIWNASSKTTHWGELDFSPEGAQLYRAIMAEWLGTEWEDDRLRVEHVYHWNEHHYSESPEGFEDQIQEHLAWGRLIVSRRETPIGPWCIHWTHHYPAGYRMELELQTSAGLMMD